ncbi:DUF2865 domain-containing protein [Terrihabitans rhizophilus]|jgi:hypothetical protein|uniref:DUF2865 domain-containing protein n=1 Tax=Terrihabitans rhizophilus TaxID=3092662 RepID=A0ABU4RP76_9HYPH|nr:DUF2865 domain-containing protein [Terrihabitans sp. PJ23]MDX6806627.1 DUF2865 domain-containing protein [Terrihabitans sp. PJ23]
MTVPASAQQGSPTCVQLERQLAALDNQPSGRNERVEQSYAVARQNLDRATAQFRGMACTKNSLFGPRQTPECRGLDAQINRLQDQVEDLADEVRRSRSGGGASDPRRRGVLAALAQNGCRGGQAAAAPQERRQGGLFGLLFGNRGAPPPEAAPPPQAPAETVRANTFRTVCVRTCDGFFFPVSYATTQSNFGNDENICRRTCPGTEAMLFAYPNPGGNMEQATSLSGQSYKDMPNAFAYQTKFVKDCSCKPANQSWAQALAGAEDATVRNGDIVVDEDRSRAMSQPGGGSARTGRAEASRAAQDSARSVTTEGPQEEEAAPSVVEPDVRTANPVYAPPRTFDAPVYAPPR